MSKYLKYILFVGFLVASVGLIFGFPADRSYLPTYLSDDPPVIVAEDSTPRYPVKGIQINNYEDLNTTTPIDFKNPSNVKSIIEYDADLELYLFKTRIGDNEIATPFSLSPDEYLQHTLKQSMADYFKRQNQLDANGKTKGDNKEFSLKDIRLNIKPTDRLFGPGGLKFTASGYVEATMGFKYTSIDNPTMPMRNRKKTIFQFKEDIQLNVDASLGEKMNFGMNYDTKSMLDFDSKKIKLAYDGHEDEIIKHIEAGNMSMSTTNSLINGGSALFGINTELQFGKLRVNAVISQQESQSHSVNTKGGVQVNEFEFKADKYDENRHFFLAHYFRDNYDKAMSKLPFVKSPITITELEVWVTNKNGDPSQARNIVAFADLAERDHIKNTSKWFPLGTEKAPYNGANDQYQQLTSTPLNDARDLSKVTSTFNGVMESGLDYEKVERARLLRPTEYTFNPQLGYISLNSALQSDEVLAVAYKYTMNGRPYQVGEISLNISDKKVDNPTIVDRNTGALFLKLLKPVSLSPRSHTWDLMMKNVYYLGANSIQKEKFKLNISHQSDTLGTYLTYIPDGNIKNQPLLRVVGLDRLDSRNNERPQGDGIFDYLEGFTINSENGRIYFPVVEPFGEHLRKKIGNPAVAKKYIYQELYDSTKTVAQQIAEKNKFKIHGSYRGSASNADINLNATNVPLGSVRVTAGGVPLLEGTDYIVDYMSGVVTIINENYVQSTTPIQVSLEDRTFSMQRKTMMGLNLSYDISKKFNVGGTIMHLYEKPLVTKATIGNEAVKNTLWGLNASYKTESQWLTNLVDKLPFVEATAPSQIALNAEFAHLIAGHYQNKETGAYSYLDDFESSQSNIDIKSPYAWSLASTPADEKAGPTAMFPEGVLSNDIEYGKNRAQLSWFMIDGIFTRKGSSLTPQHIKNDVEQLSNHFVREIYIREIYPNKDLSFNESGILPVLNLSYYPNERGPYNLDGTKIEQDGTLKDPKTRWGGITRKMDVRDFETSNIEYIEFWLMDPFVYNSATHKGGDLYFNLGEISEDVLKDGKKFYENGMPIDDDPTATETTIWGKVPTRQSTVYAFDDKAGKAGRAKQDVGLNGLSTAEELQFATYANYLNSYKANLSGTALAELSNNPHSPLNDPAGDNFRFYRGPELDRNEVSILDRYKYFNGTEGNSAVSGQSGQKYSSSAKSVPDVEDIDQDNTLNETEAYFQYRVELKPTKMKVGSNHIVDSRESTVRLRNGSEGKVTWYQFKIPVKGSDKERIGNIQDFKSIRFMRMFLTQFEEPVFLRFGTLQLVRGDWRVYEQTLNANNTPSGNGTMDVSTVNIEENGDRKPVNYVLPPGLNRSTDPDQTQLTQENEQSLTMKVQQLESGDARAIYKNTSYDLRRYKRLQLFTHAEELIDGTPLGKGELTIFLRLGSDAKNNYYEYEIPLTITPHGRYSQVSSKDKETVWPKENMFDFPLELLKDLKLDRNKKKRLGSSISYSTIHTGYDPRNPTNKISVKGNPSLAEVNVIMIGVRNNSRSTQSGEVWINELRLTDFDEKGGWAAKGSVSINLSDIGTFDFAGHKETAGFGALDQSLMERRSDDYVMYNVATSLDLGRFLPEKAKLSIPFFYSYSSETSTPEYDPFDKDVKLKEAMDIVDTKHERDSIKSLAQEKTTTKSISFNNIRLNIRSKTPMPYDPANFTFGYAFSKTEFKSPTTEYDVSKNYRLSLSYSYSPIVKTWEPFKGNKGKGAGSKYLRSLGFNYIPSNIAFNSIITRYYTETMVRDVDNYGVGLPNNSTFLSWNQNFYWDRDFNINWDFTKNLKYSFQSGTKAEIVEPYKQVNKKADRDAYQIWRDSVWQSIKRLGSPLEYRQTTKITYQLPFRDIAVMNWANSNISYSSGYEWYRGAKVEGEDIGNSISNQMTIDFNNRFNLLSLYNKSAYLKKVNDRFSGRKKKVEATKNKRNRKKILKKKVLLANKDGKNKLKLKHNFKSKEIDVVAIKDGKPYSIKYKKISADEIEINNKDSVNLAITITTKDPNEKEKNVWSDIGQYAARGLMSVRSISVNYSRRKETNITGYIPRVGNAFGQSGAYGGLAPGLGFAFGFDGGEDFIKKAYDKNWLISSTENINPAVFSNTEKMEMRMQLEPFNGMKIELNAGRERERRTELQFMFKGMPRTLGGSFSITTIAISSAFQSGNAKNNYKSKAFDKFLDYRKTIQNRVEQQYNGKRYPDGGFMDEPGQPIGAQYAQGGVKLNSTDVLIPAFLAAYTGKNPNKMKLTAFPSLWSMLPNWKMSYDGLSKMDWVKKFMKSIRFNHGYTCFYQVGNYSSFGDWVGTGTDGELGFIRDVLTGKPTPSTPYSISSVTISELFNPLFGVEGVFNNNMSVNTQYNSSRTVALNTSSYQIVESLQKELVVGFGYRINEFNQLIGLSDKKAVGFNNDLNIKADISHRTVQALIRRIEENFTQATSGTTVTTLRMSADYTMSRAFSLKAFFERIMNKPLITSNGYPTSNNLFGISVKFTLTQ